MRIDAVTAVLLALAVYRVTVLLTKDYIAEPLRALLRRLPDTPPESATLAEYSAWIRGPHSEARRRLGRHAAYLAGCPWCCSVWIAGALTPLTALVGWWVWVDAALAASAVASVLFRHVNQENE